MTAYVRIGLQRFLPLRAVRRKDPRLLVHTRGYSPVFRTGLGRDVIPRPRMLEQRNNASFRLERFAP